MQLLSPRTMLPRTTTALAAAAAPPLNFGSLAHSAGACSPCAFHFKDVRGCLHGAKCKFCHLCPPGELKRRKREKVAQMVRAEMEVKEAAMRMGEGGGAGEQGAALAAAPPGYHHRKLGPIPEEEQPKTWNPHAAHLAQQAGSWTHHAAREEPAAGGGADLAAVEASAVATWYPQSCPVPGQAEAATAVASPAVGPPLGPPEPPRTTPTSSWRWDHEVAADARRSMGKEAQLQAVLPEASRRPPAAGGAAGAVLGAAEVTTTPTGSGRVFWASDLDAAASAAAQARPASRKG